MKVVLFGANGQLGSAFQALTDWDSANFVSLNRQSFDFCNLKELNLTLNAVRPDVVINCAAYTAVDLAENESALCFATNETAVKQLAIWCRQNDVLLVHFSTDYVFDGLATTPYNEQDLAAPVNTYGLSKWKGEQAIQQICTKYFIFRTSWLFSRHGNNFFRTMYALAAAHRNAEVVNDQIGCPTCADDLAREVLHILLRYHNKSDLAYGVYHLAGYPAVSWYQFASAIYERMPTKGRVTAIPGSMWPQIATRPLYTALDCTKAETKLGVAPLCWRTALNNMSSFLIESG